MHLRGVHGPASAASDGSPSGQSCRWALVQTHAPLESVLAAWSERLSGPLPPEALQLLAALPDDALEVLGEAFGPTAKPATRDPLTGTLSRPVLEEALAHEVASAARHGAPCLLVADLDGLTGWIEKQGHLAADLLVVRLTEILTRSSRRSDVLGRLGVDQLALVLPRTDAARGMVVARRVLARALADLRTAERVKPGTTVHHPLLSVALVHLSAPRSVADLLMAADAALERARRAGGRIVELAGDGDVPDAVPA